MSERPAPPPEGVLIAGALKRAKLSAREAARRSGLSEGRWRQIVSGSQTVSAGVHAPVRAPAETLARMGAVVALTPEDFIEAGREDVAAVMRGQEAAIEDVAPLTLEDLENFVPQTAAEKALLHILRVVQREQAERVQLRADLEEVQQKIAKLTRDNDGPDGDASGAKPA